MSWCRRVAALTAILLGTVACSDSSDDSSRRSGENSNTATTAVTTAISASPNCPTADPGTIREGLDQLVTVLMFCGGRGMDPDTDVLVPVKRLVPADREPLDATMLQVFHGATPSESAAGLSSMGGAYLASTYIQTTMEDGVATLRLRDSFQRENNISTTTESAYVLRQIEANVFQFPEITGLEFLVGNERWCGFQNPCMDDMPYPYFTPS